MCIALTMASACRAEAVSAPADMEASIATLFVLLVTRVIIATFLHATNLYAPGTPPPHPT